jgi:hypothetical protein
MINEEIIGGLVSALSRGESLENAMMTFYNAGYKKDDIEDSAKEVYNQLGPQLMGVKGSLQETLNTIAVKAGVSVTPKEPPPEKIPDKQFEKQKEELQQKIVLQTPVEKKPVEKVFQVPVEKKTVEVLPLIKKEEKPQNSNQEEIAVKMEEAIKDLKQVNIISNVDSLNKPLDKSQPIVQHVSSYSGVSPKPVNKTITYILIIVLALLLVALGAVFFFKADLIALFNNFGIG